MGIQIALNHRTHYRYEKEIFLGPQVIQLRPAPHCRVPILNYSLDVTPTEHLLNWQMDPHSNRLARLIFSKKTSEFVVEVNLVADLSPINPFEFFLEPGVEEYPFSYAPRLSSDLEPYRSVSAPGPRLEEFLSGLRNERCGTITFLLQLNRKVRDEIAYGTRLAPGVQTSEETLEKCSGSCRDSAWLLVECLRNLGIAARFVSGYLIQLATDANDSGSPGDGPKADSADLHAWAEVYLPGAGWIGLDPTSGLVAGEGHIPLVCTPTASQAAPIEGTAELPSTEFNFSMTVRRLNEARRPSKPLSDQEWLRVRDVADVVDSELKVQDVRLTMGGEPTFVGIDEPESPQWNLEALGALKRRRGLALIQGLRGRMAPGALLHYGQGKWYPGESLPRWAMSCFWRRDGVPIWEDSGLVADEDQNYGFGAADSFRFMEALTRRLQVSAENVLPAYDPEAGTPAGYILPIRRRQPEGRLRWSSQLWFPRPERLILTPGESPIGFRIPTESVPWVAPDELAYEFDQAPFADRAKLPSRATRPMELFETVPKADPLPAVLRAPDEAPELIRPSLCVQAREGRMHVFLPYASVLADYLDMVAAVEDTCRFLNM
ncbi:MAG TPA: transglutaminase family protein, partial [Terracidiphilus sp.]